MLSPFLELIKRRTLYESPVEATFREPTAFSRVTPRGNRSSPVCFY